MMMMSLRDVNGKLATLFNNGTRTKSTNNNLSKSSIGCLFAASKERESAL